MTFTPPAFSALCPRTLNLDTLYSKKINRYSINIPVEKSGETAVVGPSCSNDTAPSTESASAIHTSNLETLLARAHKVEECKTDRTTQRDVIVQVMNEARLVLREGDENKIKQATLFLMGTLLHRYFRIINECNSSLFFGYKDPGNSDLFIAIRQALNLPPYVYGVSRANDLKILDVKTVLDSLHAFKENMLSQDEKTKLPKYRGYAHLNADKNFETYLGDIIQEHLVRGRKIIKQFKAIDYIQSLARALKEQREKIEDMLIYWGKDLQKDYPDFTKLNSGTPEENALKIEAHIETHVKPGLEREMILDVLYTPEVSNKLSEMDHDKFISKLSKTYSDIASQTLFAGYIPILKSPDVDDNLKFVILREVLGSNMLPAILNDKEMSDALALFERFINDNPDIVLNLEFFSGSKKYVNLIKEVIEPLQQLLTLGMQPQSSMTVS